MSMAQRSVVFGLPRIGVVKRTIFQQACQLVVRSGTRGFMYWMVAWSLGLLVLLGGFKLGGLGLGGVFLGGGVGGGGCTAAGTWRAGAGMGFWSLWGERTIRLRFAASALSLGRSRPRWLGTRV